MAEPHKGGQPGNRNAARSKKNMVKVEGRVDYDHYQEFIKEPGTNPSEKLRAAFSRLYGNRVARGDK